MSGEELDLDSGGTYGHALAEDEGWVMTAGGGDAALEDDGLCMGHPGYRIVSLLCDYLVQPLVLEVSHLI